MRITGHVCRKIRWRDEMKYIRSTKDRDIKPLNKDDYHTRCHDCGHFLNRNRWVCKDHSWKKHALCDECFGLYDG